MHEVLQAAADAHEHDDVGVRQTADKLELVCFECGGDVIEEVTGDD